jgi:16S rRNA (cytosine967-C5)-methyltransferase
VTTAIKADDVRKEAFSILAELEISRHNTLDQILDKSRAENAGFSRRDKAFLQTLVFGVLRSRNRIDWIIRHFSKTPFRKISNNIKNTLRLGIYQILYMDRVPNSAAVNTCVELAKSCSAPWTVKYVNGLLRNVARNSAAVRFPDIADNPVPAISIRKSLPEWLVQRWLARLGLQQCVKLCDAVNTIPPLSLRTNTLKTTRRKLARMLDDTADTVVKTTHAPEGLLLDGLRSGIAEIKAYAEGKFQVQDEAAQLVSHILRPQPGQRVLDACAGLGGKTGHIAQLLDNRGEIIALDTGRKKLESLGAEMGRLGVSIVKTVRHDLQKPPGFFSPGTFDRILLDAPCSGLGVIRRNPDIRWNRDESDLGKYSARQQIFLNNLAPLVKPGGILVYAVCSMEPEENETVINHFLNKNKSFVQILIESEPVHDLPSVVDTGNCLRTFPHRHNMDGFFAVCLRRLE